MTAKPIPAQVLVVDDDVMSRELLCILLEAEGYAVESADSGEAALALLGREGPTPDLVLADVQMPGTTGAQLAGKLRRACGEQTLLLAMSGSQPSEKAISRFDGFLLKPFRMEEIAAALSTRSLREAAVKRERWTVVRGPAGAALPTGKLVSIHAPAGRAASKKGMNNPGHDMPPAEPVSSSPVLNEKIFQQLAGSMPAQQLRELYTMCVNDARARIATMRRLADAHDGAKFVREAHSIKGGCGMLGATELHGMAAALESNGLDGATQGGQEVNSLDELAAACDRLERMLGSRV
ncbi:MAG: response regulator [Acidobacteriaceae bacterium]|jgi:CheY-like chemotaxis protein/HPt (histidine-containing phosphotransfer) domain-containing protein